MSFADVNSAFKSLAWISSMPAALPDLMDFMVIAISSFDGEFVFDFKFILLFNSLKS